MNAVYVANFCNFNAFQDICDGGEYSAYIEEDFESCASPQLVSISQDLTDEWIEKVKQRAIEELLEIFTESDKPASISWTATEMEYPKEGRPNMVLRGVADWGPNYVELDMPSIVIVIQQVKLD